MKPNVMSTHELLKNNIQTAPKVLLNIGVGPRPHCEATVFKKLWPNIRIIGFEPIIGVFKDRITDYPGELYPWALWSVPAIKKLLIVRGNAGKSSLFIPHPEWHGKKHFNIGKTCDEALISCVTLDQLDEAFNHPLDVFLWMDIEGAELEALKGGRSLLTSKRVKWIMVEVSHTNRRIGEPSEDSISTFLKDCGFSLKCQYNCGLFFHDSLYVEDKVK